MFRIVSRTCFMAIKSENTLTELLETSYGMLFGLSRDSAIPTSLTNEELVQKQWEIARNVLSIALKLRETDTTLALAFRLLNSNSKPVLKEDWSLLLRCTWYAGLEANAVLLYNGHPRSPSEMRYFLNLTGGVVPQTSRYPCSNGEALAMVLGYMPNTAIESLPLLPELLENFMVIRLTVQKKYLQDIFSKVICLYPDKQVTTSAIIELLIKLIKTTKNGRTDNIFLSQLFGFLPLRYETLEDFQLINNTLRLFLFYFTPFSQKETNEVIEHMRRIAISFRQTLQDNASDSNPLNISDNAIFVFQEAAISTLLRCRRLDTSFSVLESFFSFVENITSDHVSDSSILIQREQYFASIDAIKELHSTTDASSLDKMISKMMNHLYRLMSLCMRHHLSFSKSVMINEDETELLRDEIQHWHAEMVRILCMTHEDKNIQLAYETLLAHRTHGVTLSRPLLDPLFDAMSKRGDSRIFYLVDISASLHQQGIDMNTVIFLFKACQVAQDHERAKTLFQLLQKIESNFLCQAPHELYDILEEMKLIEKRNPYGLIPSMDATS